MSDAAVANEVVVDEVDIEVVQPDVVVTVVDLVPSVSTDIEVTTHSTKPLCTMMEDSLEDSLTDRYLLSMLTMWCYDYDK